MTASTSRLWPRRRERSSPRDEPHRVIRTPGTETGTQLEIRLLRSEAEALILYEPAFPADPFAN
jgi:hypothetical protein